MDTLKLAGSVNIGPRVMPRPGMFPGLHCIPDGGEAGGAGGADGGQGGASGGASGQGGQGGQGGASQGGSQGGADDGKMEFNPAQQAWLEKKFNEAYRKGAEKSEATLKAENERLAAELKKLQGKKPEGKQGEGEAKTYTQEDVKRMLEEAATEANAKVTAAEARAISLLSKDRQAAIVAAAAKANVAGDYREFSKLVIDNIIHDDKGNLIVTEDGSTVKLNSKGDPISVDDYVKAYIDARPHLKKGTGTAGAGSSSAAGNGAGAGSGAKPKNLTEANAALARAFGGQK